MYWEYDSRTAHRWNVDPRPRASASPYSTFAGNPIFYTDPFGDTTHIYDTRGNYFGVVPDNLPNEQHFLDPYGNLANNYNEIKEKLANKEYNAAAELLRSSSEYFIGENTRADLEAIAESAENEKWLKWGHKPKVGLERGFILQRVEGTRELRAKDVTETSLDPTERSETKTPFANSSLEAYKNGFDNFVMQGHTHGIYSIKALGRSVEKDYRPSILNKPSSTTTLQDYDDIVFGDYTGHPTIIATPLGFTVYSTASKSLGYGNYKFKLTNEGQVFNYSGEKTYDFND